MSPLPTMPELWSFGCHKKSRRTGHTRYYCKSCGHYFTDRRRTVCFKNKEVWFRGWFIGKQTIDQLAERSNYSMRHLKSYFYQLLPRCPVWHIQHPHNPLLTAHRWGAILGAAAESSRHQSAANTNRKRHMR